MKHKGKAMQAAFQLILWTLVALFVVVMIGIASIFVGAFLTGIASTLFGAWMVFSLFCLWFFRDPDPAIPADAQAIVAPAHGRVDVIDETSEPEFIGGRCRRLSIFLSVVEVHVQKAPVAGKIALLKHTPGEFMSALKLDSATHNENTLIGFESGEQAGERIAIRLIAGVLARRIVPWVETGEQVERGQRISLIQFGSRVDIYLPLTAQIRVAVGDKVRGGETVIASRT